jgi:Icc-related predicted phosphoesterase
MKILAVGDFHGTVPQNLKRFVRKNKFDIVLCTGDTCSSDRIEWKYWDRLRSGEKLEDILGKDRMKKMIEKEIKKSKTVFNFLEQLNVPIILVYGNGDITNSYLRRHKMKPEGIDGIVKSTRNIRLLKCNGIEFNRLTILGHSGYRGYTTKKGDEKGEFSPRARKINLKWKNDLNRLSKSANGSFIFLTHDVPFGRLDEIRNRKSPAFGEHIGDEFYLSFDKKHQPLLHVCGHMHENQGLEKIGKTIVVNPGFGGKGEAAIITLPEMKISFI